MIVVLGRSRGYTLLRDDNRLVLLNERGPISTEDSFDAMDTFDQIRKLERQAGQCPCRIRKESR